MAQIMMNQDPDVQHIIDTFNGYIPYLLNDYLSAGKHVVGVSMSNINLGTPDSPGPDHDSVFADDGTHPGNNGFQKMASNFFLGIQAADADGWIHLPPGQFTPADPVPPPVYITNPSTKWAVVCDVNATWSGPTAGFPGVGAPDPSFHTDLSTLLGVTNGNAGQSLDGGFVWLRDINSDVGVPVFGGVRQTTDIPD